MRRGSLLQLIALTLVAFAIGAAVAIFIPWMPTPASKEAGRIWFTYWFATWISLGIFAVVVAVIVYALLKFRVEEGDLSDGPPVHGHTTLEIVWTAVPFVLVTAISVVSAIVLAQDSHAGKNPLRITVTGQQFAWSFTYPNKQTYGIMRIPKGRHVLVSVTSNDVIHSFWVPQMGQKQDAVPGQMNHFVLTPTRLGTFPLICTELCGLGHSLMRSTVIVLSPKDYKAWYAGEAAAPVPSPSGGGDAAALFTGAGTCGACHAFAPAKAAGVVGPSLDHLKRDAARAGQPVEAYVRQSIENPDAYVVPGYLKGTMAASCCTQLTSDQVDQLVQYLTENAGG